MSKVSATRLKALDGRQLIQMFAAATAWLEANVDSINALNVFPVPDGDTGTNMFLTMRDALQEARQKDDSNASVAFSALARGALMGARGNSGVILSQVFAGCARGVAGNETLCGPDFAASLKLASDHAYKALTRPVEGTILTVIRDVAEAAQEQLRNGDCDICAVFEHAAEVAKASVARTPDLLPVLRDADVVDAGGQGLYVLLHGASVFLKGGRLARATGPKKGPAPRWIGETRYDDRTYGFCTEFFVKGDNLPLATIKERIVSMGDSAVVIGDSQVVKVHVHTLEPDAVLSYAASLGTLEKVKVDNIDQQHRDYVTSRRATPPTRPIAVVAVASGDGMMEVLKSLGALVVPGGQTMNPSAQDILQAVEGASARAVVVLPNNKNVVLTARQAQTLSGKEVAVVPTETVPQGVSAMVAFNPELDLQSNLAAMEKARASVRTLEVTRAVRSARVGEVEVRQGQAIGFVDGELKAAGPSIPGVLKQLIGSAVAQPGGLVTIYAGADSRQDEAQAVARWVEERFPGVEVELVAGGQPHYDYIVSVE